MNKRISAIFLSVVFIAAMSATAFAHPGRTDSRGGHRDNENVSGLGNYHFHCDGYPPHLHYDGVCPYTRNSHTAPSSTPTVKKAKTVTTTVTASNDISAKSDKKEDTVFNIEVFLLAGSLFLFSLILFIKCLKSNSGDK